MRLLRLLLLLLLVGFTTATAQVTPASSLLLLATGTRIRVKPTGESRLFPGGDRRVGTLRALTRDSLTIDWTDGGSTGAFIGAAIGGGAGLVGGGRWGRSAAERCGVGSGSTRSRGLVVRRDVTLTEREQRAVRPLHGRQPKSS